MKFRGYTIFEVLEIGLVHLLASLIFGATVALTVAVVIEWFD